LFISLQFIDNDRIVVIKMIQLNVSNFMIKGLPLLFLWQLRVYINIKCSVIIRQNCSLHVGWELNLTHIEFLQIPALLLAESLNNFYGLLHFFFRCLF